MRLVNPTGRNTNARQLNLGAHTIYFSYETPIAYNGPCGRARIANHWGPTTGKHFRELRVDDFPIVPDDVFDRILGTITGGAEQVSAAVDGTPANAANVALDGLLKRYVELVQSGDCGHWDPETDVEVIAARAVVG